jgi:geranyl-CoA carboxylase alpha subunit
MKRVTIPWNDQKLAGWVHKDGPRLWLHLEGETFFIEESRGSRKSSDAADEASPDIKAPMPGKITKVLVAVGEEVSKGQVLIMMEAMKMEYSLKAKVDGTIETLGAAVGDQVALNHLLLKIKPTIT